MRLRVWLACGAALIGAALAPPVLAQTPRGLDRLSHILVLYMENRSFDNLFGEFPGANGIAQAGEAAVQRDGEGKPFAGAAGGEGALPHRKEPGGRPGVTAACRRSRRAGSANRRAPNTTQ